MSYAASGISPRALHSRRIFLRQTFGASVVMLVAACAAPTPSIQPAPTPAPATESQTGPTSAPTTAGLTPRRGGTLLNSNNNEPDHLDPHRQTVTSFTQMLDIVYDRLVYIDATGKPQPWMAESWTLDDQGTAITFKLRPGIKFHDGTTVDANAIKFNFDRLTSTTAPLANRGHIGPLTGTQAVDDLTVRMTWSKPYASAFVELDGPVLGIVSPAAVAKFGDQFGRNPTGSGPYRLLRWDAGKELVFEANPDYKNLRSDIQNPGRVYVDQMSIRFITDDATRTAALENGEIQVTPIVLQEIENLKKNPDVEVNFPDKLTIWEHISFNTSREPFNDRNVRQAVGLALNPKEALAVSYIYGDLSKSTLPSGVPGYDAAVGEQYGFSYDPEKAKTILAQGGYTPGAGGILARDGKPLQMTFTTWNTNEPTRVAQLVQSQLKAIGIDVQVQTMDVAALLAKMRNSDYEFSFVRGAGVDVSVLSTLFRSPGAYKQYSNPQLDTVLDVIDSSFNQAQRFTAASTAQRMLLEDAALVPMFSEQFNVVTRKEVQGFKFTAVGIPTFRDVWLTR